MIFVRPLLMKSIPPGTVPVPKLVMRKDPRTGKIQVYTQRYHVSPEEAKMPRFREASRDEVEGREELFQSSGKSASKFMDRLTERWQGEGGDAELNALFVTGKFAYRRIGGRFDLAPELLDLYDGERCKGADKEASKRVLEMARQVRIGDKESLRAWLEKAVELKHKRIREVIGAGDAGWVAVPISPLPLKPEEDRPFIRGAESNDPAHAKQ
jgi:hypothetical protein